jgi:hypothetical protein
MTFNHVLLLLYVFLALYAAGMMTTLQLQHFALYPRVGKEAFRDYITANNKAAILPSILPALLLFVVTAMLTFIPQQVSSRSLVVASLLCNCINLISTGVWQAKLHGQLAQSGYREELVRKLVRTNWIRTSVLLVQAALATAAVGQL